MLQLGNAVGGLHTYYQEHFRPPSTQLIIKSCPHYEFENWEVRDMLEGNSLTTALISQFPNKNEWNKNINDSLTQHVLNKTKKSVIIKYLMLIVARFKRLLEVADYMSQVTWQLSCYRYKLTQPATVSIL